MIVLALRTDKPEAELYLLKDGSIVDQILWEAHRQLAETLHQQINVLLARQGVSLTVIDGIVVYEGPGSFTGLRIGVSVANAIAYGLGVPIVGATGEKWLNTIGTNDDTSPVIPKYGSEPHITAQKK